MAILSALSPDERGAAIVRSACRGGLDGLLSNRSSSLFCLPPPPWTQCTGTSDLQPSLDRARSASTNCLRPDASLHSPERERYTVRTFLISSDFPHQYVSCHGASQVVHPRSSAACLPLPPLPSKSMQRHMCTCGSPRAHIHIFPRVSLRMA